MPAKTVKAKKTPIKKKKTAAPARAKAKAKVKAKSKPASAPQNPSGKGFMWKLLEQKRRKQEEMTQHQQQTNPHTREPAFAKFQGPRRRAG